MLIRFRCLVRLQELPGRKVKYNTHTGRPNCNRGCLHIDISTSPSQTTKCAYQVTYASGVYIHSALYLMDIGHCIFYFYFCFYLRICVFACGAIVIAFLPRDALVHSAVMRLLSSVCPSVCL